LLKFFYKKESLKSEKLFVVVEEVKSL